jgi:hypothetical protein
MPGTGFSWLGRVDTGVVELGALVPAVDLVWPRFEVGKLIS